VKQNPGGVRAEWDEDLVLQLMILFRQEKDTRPNFVVETGTYHGEGTTAQIIEAATRAFKKTPYRPKFITIEADEVNYNIAKGNLADRKWVTIVHGSSVPLQDAINFIKNDEMLINHEQYPDICMDAADPIPFYLAETEGKLAIFGGKASGEDNVFGRIKSDLDGKIPLFVLDSCGGIGWLEFQTIMKMMGDKRLYYVWLHDITHVKHFRSYQEMDQNPDKWQILFTSPDRWVLAMHVAG
jgi:hypothetical protein